MECFPQIVKGAAGIHRGDAETRRDYAEKTNRFFVFLRASASPKKQNVNCWKQRGYTVRVLIPKMAGSKAPFPSPTDWGRPSPDAPR